VIPRILPAARHFIVRWSGVLAIGSAALCCQDVNAKPPSPLNQPETSREIPINPEPIRKSGIDQIGLQQSQPSRPKDGSSTFSPWRDGSIINILADQTPLEDILQEFGNQMNIRVFTTPAVQGKVSGRFVGLTPEKFLDQLSRAYGLDWLYYNQQIYFYSSSESETVVRTLRYLPGDEAVKIVEHMGIVGTGASIRGIPGTPLVMLTGPPKFVEMAQEVLRTLEAQNAYQQNEPIIQVFPIKYAWAYDVQLVGGSSAGGGNIGYGVGPGVVQGVATLLAQLVGGGGARSPISLGNFVPQSKPVPSVLDQAGAQQQVARAFPPNRSEPQDFPSFQQNGRDSRGSSSSDQTNQKTADKATPVVPPTSNVAIIADVRSNSVVIRDVRENMPFYQAAIAKLDVPVRVVEISASIVDADVNSGRILGVNGINISPLGKLAGVTFGTGNTDGGNISLSGVYGTNQITAALNFLETNNKAKTLSRPTLVTLDNYVASINDQQSAYVPIKGGRDTPGNLFEISSGLTLQVVPHITTVGGRPDVSLQIVITEGKVDGSNDSNRSRKQTTLLTQTVVRMDQSLLIGGLYRKLNSKERAGYPWLSSIPVVNFLFSTSNKRNAVVERLILITPRVVDIYAKNLGDYSQYFRPSPEVAAAAQKAQEALLPPAQQPANIPGKRKRPKSDDDF